MKFGSLNKRYTSTVICHLFYPKVAESLIEKLTRLDNEETCYLFNISRTIRSESLIDNIKNSFNHVYIISAPDKGRDIGGKLALIDCFIQAKLHSDYILFLHDKQSNHWFAGDVWREKLFSIIEPPKIKVILDQFKQHPTIGIIGAGEFIKDEFDRKTNEFKTPNNTKLIELLDKYRLKIRDYRFVAGMMFWVRSSIIQNFFSIHSPLSCRELLEEGNFTDLNQGTYTHSWERIFCWLANDQGYFIKGI